MESEAELTVAMMDRLTDHDGLSTWRGPLSRPTHTGYARNPLCGDEIWLDLLLAGGVVQQVRFRGQGCVVSQACASMLCEGVEGKTIEHLRTATPEELMMFGFRDLTMNRQRCALVAFQAVCRALVRAEIASGKESETVDIP